MACLTDNPVDGPGAATCDEGCIYARGNTVFVDGKASADGSYTMGGPIARCDNAEQAAEIARRCAAFKGLVAAAKVGLRSLETELLKIIDNRPNISAAALDRLNADPIMVKLRADIASARAALALAEGT